MSPTVGLMHCFTAYALLRNPLCWTGRQWWSAGLWSAPFPNHEICWRCVIEHELYVTMNFFMNVRYKCALFYSPCMYLARINLLIPLMFLVVVCLTIQTHHLLCVCQRHWDSLHTVAVFFFSRMWALGWLQVVWMTAPFCHSLVCICAPYMSIYHQRGSALFVVILTKLISIQSARVRHVNISGTSVYSAW